ncbi:hypothetical protein A462_24794 [Pseudomonas sp. Ag1]|jgi:hypothetical protein|nr:hypothetical protein A462_24794 [Pseudomonas sp. Ag1]
MNFFTTILTLSSNAPLPFSLFNIVQIVNKWSLRDFEITILITESNFNLLLTKQLLHSGERITRLDICFQYIRRNKFQFNLKNLLM